MGPASATATALARFNGATGQLLTDGAVLEDSDGNLTGISTAQLIKAATTTTLGASGALIGSTSNTGNQIVASTTNWPTTGYLAVDSEVVAYTVTDGTNINVTARGKFGTSGASHSNGATASYYRFFVATSTSVAPSIVVLSNGFSGLGVAVPDAALVLSSAAVLYGTNITVRGANAQFTSFQKNGVTSSGFDFDASNNPKAFVGSAAAFTAKSDRVTHHGTLTPASAAASGAAGDIAWDSGFIYVCTATNTWKRVAIATW